MSPAPLPPSAVAKSLDPDVCLGRTLARPRARETDERDDAGLAREKPRNDDTPALGTRACTEGHLLPNKTPATMHAGAAAVEEAWDVRPLRLLRGGMVSWPMDDVLLIIDL